MSFMMKRSYYLKIYRRPVRCRQSLTLRMQEGYDHSYHFIASFIGEHIAYHAKALKAE